jgi:fructokinase
MMVSFDPNVRTHLWRDVRELRALCDDVLPLSDVVKLSEDELEICLGVRDPAAALDRLAALGVQLGCVTLGARGAVARRGGEIVEVPAPAVEVVDTTGAGDLFAAGFLFGQAEGRSLEDSLRIGSLAAAEIISHFGARPEADLKALIGGGK